MESGNQPSVFGDLLVTHTMGNNIHDSTKWTRFISIVIIVCLFLFLILALVAGTDLTPAIVNAFPAGGNAMGVLMVIKAIVTFLTFSALAVFLLRFTILTRRGLEMRNQALFNEGLKSLKVFFIIYGVYLILTLLYDAYSLLSL